MKKLFQPAMLCYALALTLAPATLAGQDQLRAPRTQIPAVRLERAPTIDGVLEAGEWEMATPLELPFEFLPGNNSPAPVRTECRVGYTTHALYVGCKAHDPAPERIRSYLSARDKVDGQDVIVVSLDPFGTDLRSQDFFVTPAGVQADGVYDQQSNGFDFSWDALWNSGAQRLADGYSVEWEIPFRALRFPESTTGGWTFFIRRGWPRDQAVYVRSARIQAGGACVLCQADRLVGLEGIAAGGRAQITPTVTAQSAQAREATTSARFGEARTHAELGGDIRWNAGSNVTFNATINPDFSQIEADAVQIEENTRFTLQYPERRPFFLEGNDLFNTQIQAVFTRSIADPEFGVRVTGSAGDLVGGALAVRDARTNLLLPSASGSRTVELRGPADAAVGRVRWDGVRGLSIGALGTARANGDYHNLLGGFDAFVQPAPVVRLRLQALATSTAYPEDATGLGEDAGRTLAGHSFRFNGVYTTRNASVGATYSVRNEGYRADLGFEPQVDLRYWDVNAFRHFWGGPDSWYRRLSIGAAVVREDDYSGRPLQHWEFLNLAYLGPRQFSIDNFLRHWKETYRGETFDVSSVVSNVAFNPSQMLSARLRLQMGHGLEYTSSRRARDLQLTPSATFRLGHHLELGVQGSRRWLTIDEGELLDTEAVELRGAYHFTARTSARVVLGRRSTTRDPMLYAVAVQPRVRSLLTQLLFSYRPSPQTAVYVGYGDSWAGGPTERGIERPLQQSSRSVYGKVSYAWHP